MSEQLSFDDITEDTPDVDQPAEAHDAPPIFTVSEVTAQIKQQMEESFADVWVVGEVSRYTCASSGHWYFTVKDEDSVLKVVSFRGMNQRFKFKLEEGMEVVCHGKIDLYPKRGEYQLIADYMEPKGQGALQLAFEQLKKRLQEEGLFSSEFKKKLPFLPKRIGVVTSPTGAAVRDIINVLRRRMPVVNIIIAPAKVQGVGAAEEIAQALKILDLSGNCDVIIVGRGGGSIEDLWAFNEEVVARALYECRTPVVSAVGHEIDFTIADFVADLRAPTPSAAAEIVVPDIRDLRSSVRERKLQLTQGLKRWLQLRAQKLQDLRIRLKPPTNRFSDLLLQIDHCRERLVICINSQLSERRARIGKLAAELNHLSPLSVLAKGYSVVTDEQGHAIRRVSQLKIGTKVSARFADGSATAIIEKMTKRSDN